MLTQHNQQNHEVPITFMSYNFNGADLNDHEVDKKAFASLKYITKIVVPYPVVRNLLVQKDLGDKIEPWVPSLQEYDLEIKPSSVVRGKGIL